MELHTPQNTKYEKPGRASKTCLNSRNTECDQNYLADCIIVEHLYSLINIMSIKFWFKYVTNKVIVITSKRGCPPNMP